MNEKNHRDAELDRILAEIDRSSGSLEEPNLPETDERQYEVQNLAEELPEPEENTKNDWDNVPESEEEEVPDEEAAFLPENTVAVRQTAPQRRRQPADRQPSADRNRRKPLKKKRKRLKWPLPLIWTTLVVSVSILLSMVVIALGRDLFAIGKLEDEQILEIPDSSTTAEIAQLLYEQDIIRFPKLFQVMSRLSGADAKYIAGEHIVSPDMAYETIISVLCKPALDNQETVNVTIPEGMNLFDAAEKLEEAGVCDASRFLYFFNLGDYGYGFEEHLSESSSLQFYRMEGYLFPDTYTFYVDMDPQLVVQKIYQNFNLKMTSDYFTRMQELGMTLDEVITLASIVQAEAPTAASMQKVASVFLNRLENRTEFPRLQSDPTTKYVNEVIQPNISIENESMYQAYDTYQGTGLPPGAICNPGLDAIEAVLYPAATDYYYFCANVDTGEIFYAFTLEEHNQNLELIQNQYADALDPGTEDAQ